MDIFQDINGYSYGSDEYEMNGYSYGSDEYDREEEVLKLNLVGQIHLMLIKFY